MIGTADGKAGRRAGMHGFVFVLLVIASMLFRLPALMNAGGLHSDAAVVGLQARHILRGEWSWFLWGTNYEGSADPLLTAIAFAVTGSRPLTLMVVPLIGHVLLTWLTFSLLCKRLDLALAFVITLVLVFAPYSINAVALYAPRQWCITAVVAAIWLLDGASESRWPLMRYAAGTALGGFALYLDYFAILFVGGIVLFAIACSFDGNMRAPVLRRLGACVLGSAIGGLLTWRLYHYAPPTPPVRQTARLSLALLRRNIGLFWQDCFPWILSSKVYIPEPGTPNLTLWEAPAWFHMIQTLGAVSLVLGILCGGVLVFSRSVPWRVRRLGGLGFVVSGCTIAGFLTSQAASDAGRWATRYLAPIIWTAPFALASVAYLLRTKRFTLGIVPYLVAAAISGWLGFGAYVRGPLPVRVPRSTAQEEAQLGRLLRERSIKYAVADYWLAYRLTFLWAEDPIVTPRRTDRYRPYRRGFDAASVVAFIFHPSAAREDPARYERWLKQSGMRYEQLKLADFTIFILHKQPCADLPVLRRRSTC